MTYKLYEDETERFRMALEAIVSLYEDGTGKGQDMYYVAKAALNVTPRPKPVTTRGGNDPTQPFGGAY